MLTAVGARVLVAEQGAHGQSIACQRRLLNVVFLGIIRREKHQGRGVVGIGFEAVGNLAIEIECGEPLRLRRGTAELVAVERRQRRDCRVPGREIGAVLPRFFRAGQRAVAHVEGNLLAAQIAGCRAAAVENPGSPCRVVDKHARRVADPGTQPAGRQQRSRGALECLDFR